MVKLVACDLDGTIINADGTCNASVNQAIDYLHAKNIPFAICSGRPISSILPLLNGWDMKDQVDFIIGSNGGEVMDMNDRERIVLSTISKELILAIIDEYEPLGCVPSLYGPVDELYVQRVTQECMICAQRIGMKVIQKDIRLMIRDEIKQMFIVDQARMHEIEEYYRSHQDPRYYGFKTAVNQFEFNAPDLSKKTGLKKVSEILGITNEEVMAFGDMSNDIEMLEWTKYGICMENGTDDAKAVAFAIAPSVSDDGFYQYVKNNLCI